VADTDTFNAAAACGDAFPDLTYSTLLLNAGANLQLYDCKSARKARPMMASVKY
jgi:hypothetical protein